MTRIKDPDLWCQQRYVRNCISFWYIQAQAETLSSAYTSTSCLIKEALTGTQDLSMHMVRGLVLMKRTFGTRDLEVH